VLGSAIGALVPTSVVQAQQRRSLSDPLRLGVDPSLFDSGLASALQRGFGRDTGIAVQVVPAPALPLLEALDRGEFDATLTNAPGPEARLEQQGLAHDRHAIATGDFVIVGPAPRRKVKDPAAIAGGHNAAEGLIELQNAALATPGAVTFISSADFSGGHAIEQALWRSAKIAPVAPWYVPAGKGSSLIEQVRTRGAYALVERAVWLAHGGAPLGILVEGDRQMKEEVHVMRAFRINHPAGKIFVAWIAGPKGRRVVAAQRGYRTASE
jgi:tungstate transport system substrate-binding protein